MCNGGDFLPCASRGYHAISAYVDAERRGIWGDSRSVRLCHLFSVCLVADSESSGAGEKKAAGKELKTARSGVQPTCFSLNKQGGSSHVGQVLGSGDWLRDLL